MEPKETFHPLTVEIWRHRLASIAEEMGSTLERVAYSPNIRERLDYSCAVFDAQGRLLAQAAHIPVHLGAMPLMMRALQRVVHWSPGTMWLSNDPRYGGTHLPDLTLTAPVYLPRKGRSRCIGYVACRAHHTDIGGMTPGSLPLSSSAYQEGLILPPIALVEENQVRQEVLELLCANSRSPKERRGDIAAQIAACQVGIRRLQELIEQHSFSHFQQHANETLRYAEAVVRHLLTQLPSGTWSAHQKLETPSKEESYLKLTLILNGDGAVWFDFTGTSPETSSPLNATEAITHAACAYVVRCLAPEELPTNEGCFAPMKIVAPPGTLVNARFPAATAAGNVETSQRLVDVLLEAFRQAAPDIIPADSQGTMNNVVLGGLYPASRDKDGAPSAWTYYETLAGGAGASPVSHGASAIHTHMTNTRNTPIEVLESYYPLRVVEYRLREKSGGEGTQCGGDGLVRSLQLLTTADVTLLTSRRAEGPHGARGGKPGAAGRNVLTLPDGTTKNLPAFWSSTCPPKTLLTIETPGGGGWGDPERPR